MKRRADQALLASVVDHFIHDRVRNDKKHFERDRLYVFSSLAFLFLLTFTMIETFWKL
jgi:hypothetical protein